MRTKRYQLRGGIFLAGLYLVALIFEIVFINRCFGSFCVKDDWLFYLNPGVFLVALGGMITGVVMWQLILAGLITALIIGTVFFWIGSLLGRIYGKIVSE